MIKWLKRSGWNDYIWIIYDQVYFFEFYKGHTKRYSTTKYTRLKMCVMVQSACGMNFLLMSASCRRTASRLNCTPSHLCRRRLSASFLSSAPHCFYALCLFCCLASMLPRRAHGPITVVRYCSTSELAPIWKKKKTGYRMNTQVSQLEFHVSFQHKHGYTRGENIDLLLICNAVKILWQKQCTPESDVSDNTEADCSSFILDACIISKWKQSQKQDQSLPNKTLFNVYQHKPSFYLFFLIDAT